MIDLVHRLPAIPWRPSQAHVFSRFWSSAIVYAAPMIGPDIAP